MAENRLKSLEDIIFEHKNKTYGAYRLRNNERGYLAKALLIGGTIFVIFVLLLYFYNRWEASRKEADKSVTIELADIQEPEEEEILEAKDEPPPPPPPPQQEEVAQVKMIMPEPKKNVVEEEPPPSVQETENKAIGTENKEGRSTNDAAVANGTPNEVPPAPPIPPPPDNKVFEKVDEDAAFEGKEGVSKFIHKYIDYTDRAIDNGTEGKITIRFVVEKDGSVSDVQVLGKKLGDGLDEIAISAIKKTSKKWTPGKVNGQPVRSYFKVPIHFRLPQ
ncbi:MAG: TonB family protein [Flavobacteriaceae bacterium]|jgi:protein TonB|nr:TonB family protein [Flavobacteriaceae bacterium]